MLIFFNALGTLRLNDRKGTVSDPTTADKIKNKEEQDQTNLKFSDNKLLIDLCGEFDKNLAEIEQKLSVQIVRRGNELNLFGDEISRAHGKATLEALSHGLKLENPLIQVILIENFVNL